MSSEGAALRLLPFGVGVLVYDLVMSVVAWLMEWPPQFGGSPDPDQSYFGYLFGGSAVSAPPFPLVALVIGLLLSRRASAWRYVGLSLIALVAVTFTIGVFGEFSAEHPHTPMAVVYVFGAIRLLISATLVFLAASQWRAGSHRSADAR